jgi:hypothetical protein
VVQYTIPLEPIRSRGVARLSTPLCFSFDIIYFCFWLDVAGRASSLLTFSMAELNSFLYSCPDRFGLFQVFY